MSKYILPSPEQYMQGLFKNYVLASITGQELKAEILNSEMAIFAHGMAAHEDYHKKRKNGK